MEPTITTQAEDYRLAAVQMLNAYGFRDQRGVYAFEGMVSAYARTYTENKAGGLWVPESHCASEARFAVVAYLNDIGMDASRYAMHHLASLVGDYVSGVNA